MKKQTDYRILRHTDIDELEKVVKAYIKNGYIAEGSISIIPTNIGFYSGDIWFLQNVVKEVEVAPRKRRISEVQLGDKVIFFKSRAKYISLGREYEVINCSDTWIEVMNDRGNAQTIFTTVSYYQLKIVQ